MPQNGNGNGRGTVIKVLGASLIALVVGAFGGHFAIPQAPSPVVSLEPRIVRLEAREEGTRERLDRLQQSTDENRALLLRVLERLPAR